MTKNNSCQPGIKTFNYNNCIIFVKKAIKKTSSMLSTIPPCEHLVENVHKQGVKTSDEMLFVLRIKSLSWSVILLPPQHWIEALDLGEALSLKLNTKAIAYQVTYPKKLVQYELFKAGRSIESFKHSTSSDSFSGYRSDAEVERTESHPYEWVNDFFVEQKISDLKMDRKLIVRNLNAAGLAGKEIDKLDYEITRIDAVY